jgi:hypothetical protein
MPAATTPPIQRSSTSPTGSPTGGYAEDATSPTPPDMTDRKLRAVAYVRESTEEQGQGFSPDAQREGIRRFAPENNLELIGEYCDFHSGWRKSEARPEFQRLMADAAAGKFDVVLVYHTSRLARNQVEARRYKQLLREHLGIRVISVWRVRPDGSDPEAVLPPAIDDFSYETFTSDDTEGVFAVAPTGEDIVRVVKVDGPDIGPGVPSEQTHLFLYDLITGTVRQLTFGATFDQWPTISPDGQTVAFIRSDYRAEKGSDGNFHVGQGNPSLYTVPISGGTPRRVPTGLRPAELNCRGSRMGRSSTTRK